MPSARTPDPAPAGSSRRSTTSPSPAGTAGSPAVPPAGPSPAGTAGPLSIPPSGPPSASPSARAPVPESACGGLRLIEVPSDWPPYDCEVHGTACPAAGEVSVPSPCASRECGAPGGAEPPGPCLTFSAADRPADPVVAWSRQFAQVIAEILAGARSPRQLAPWTTERVRDRISLLAQTLTPGQRPRIRRIMTSRPAARVVEMTVVLSFGPRSRALALRLEQLPGRQPAPGLPARPARWLCTEIEVG
ncbi:MAG TPA: Rv3235 family protein [Streptosporangiaceae bacterium]|nr:Rv3235 family protein [Streptosporangiaceae bacterium]